MALWQIWLRHQAEQSVNNFSAFVASRLRQLRKERDITLKEAATRLSKIMGKTVHFTTIGKLETGKMQANTEWLSAIAQAYGVSLNETMNDSLSVHAASTVPVYDIGASPFEEPSDAVKQYARSEEHRIGTVVSPYVNSASYAVSPVPEEIEPYLLRRTDSYVVIDPEDRKLGDSLVYVLRFDGTDHLVVYHDEAKCFRVLKAEPEGSLIVIGEKPFEIVGRVVFLGAKL